MCIGQHKHARKRETTSRCVRVGITSQKHAREHVLSTTAMPTKLLRDRKHSSQLNMHKWARTARPRARTLRPADGASDAPNGGVRLIVTRKVVGATSNPGQTKQSPPPRMPGRACNLLTLHVANNDARARSWSAELAPRGPSELRAFHSAN